MCRLQCARRQNGEAFEHSNVEGTYCSCMVKCTQEVAEVVGFSCLAGVEEREHAVQGQANLLIL